MRPTAPRILLPVLAVAVLSVPLLMAHAAGKDKNADAGGPPPPPKVTAANPIQRDVHEWEEFTGRFDAVEKVEIRARVSGYLDQIHFRDGQNIQQGDTLFTIDQRPFLAAMREAEAQVKSAQNRLTLASKELARNDELAKQGYASKQTLDMKTEEKQSAMSDLDAAKARLEQVRLDLEYTTIKAPISGRVSQRMVDVGNLVTGGSMGTSTMLTTLVALDPIYFNFDVDEQTYLKYARLASPDVKSGAGTIAKPVQVALADSKDYEFQGTLDFVDSTLNPQTGTVRARATFENKNYNLVPGMFGRARVMGGGVYQALMIPDEAVGVDQSRNYVLTLNDDNTIGSKTITLGPLSEGLRVIKSGLTTQDKVIIRGIQMLREGMPVTPEIAEIKPQTDVPIITEQPATTTAATPGPNDPATP